MARRPIRTLVDLALGGTLDKTLTTHRTEGQSFDQIARWLATQHGIDVSGETVRTWCKDLDALKAKAAR
jgi:hypothetical protein